MTNKNRTSNSFDRTVRSLCAEIDFLREENEELRKQLEEERAENSKFLNERLIASQQGVADALMFALSVSDDENGNLVINKENRKALAEYHKNKEA